MRRRGTRAPCARCPGIDNILSPRQSGNPWQSDQNPDICDTAWPISAENPPFRSNQRGVLGWVVPCGHDHCHARGHRHLFRPRPPFHHASPYLHSPCILGQNAPFSDSYNTWSHLQTYILLPNDPASSTCNKQRRLYNPEICVLFCCICSKYRYPLLSALETGIWTLSALRCCEETCWFTAKSNPTA